MSWQETALSPQESKLHRVWEEARTEHNTHTPPANRWSSQHTKPKYDAILYNTSIFQGLSKCHQSQALRQIKASVPSPCCSITYSSFVTRLASSSRVLAKLYGKKVKCSFSLRWYCSLDSADSPMHTFNNVL